MELCRRIDGLDESQNPLGEGAAGDGDEGQHNAGESGQPHKGPFNNKRQGEFVNNEGNSKAAGQLKKLLEGHISDKPKLVRRYVLWYWVLIHVGLEREGRRVEEYK